MTHCPTLGLWVYGDGSGAVLNVQIAGPERLQTLADHYVPLDFKGWHYTELVETESDRFEEYAWPYGRCVYDIYRANVKYDQIAGLNLWLNNVPAGEGVCCLISEIRALPVVKTRLRDPVLRVGTREIKLPFELSAGDWLEILPDGNATVFAPDGRELQSLLLSDGAPCLTAGVNDLVFSAEPITGSCRARVTVVKSSVTLSK